MATITKTQKRIMHAVLTAQRWEIMSLFQLCTDLGIDYSNAWAAVHQLAAAGMLTIARPTGRDLILSMGAINHPLPGAPIPQPYRGTVSRNNQRITHNAQGEEPMETKSTGLDYPRPDLTAEEVDKYSRQARKLNAIRDERLRLVYVAAMVAENVRLLKEVNQHREARGLKPLPVYDPEKTK